jgi:glycosyltransferase involved in cell wall biosynthesis
MRTIAAFVPNKLGVAPGQRLRIEAWAPHLQRHGWKVEFYPFESDSLHDVLYKPGHTAKKLAGLVSCYMRQLRNVLGDLRCDGVFIYREAALVGPTVIERFARRAGVPVVFDIDDPVFLPYKSPVNGWLSLLKFSRKTHTLFRLSDRVIAINRIIGDYARGFCRDVSVIPNFVDTDAFCPAEAARGSTPRIVWTGSVSTLQNLSTVAGPLRRLQEKHSTPVRIVANGTTRLDGVELEHRDWSPADEITNLQECDIGIVPLLDLRWNPWKFYLKTVQYMAAGLPVVARRLGSNPEVIEDGVNGFLVETEQEWEDRLERLIEDADLRGRMGGAARQTAVTRFSAAVQVPRVVQVFDEVYGRK